MSNTEANSGEQTIPVEPAVHVETFATHCTLTWKAGPLARFITALESVDTIPSTASVVVDDSSIAGRKRCRATALEARESVRYLRVDPDRPWSLSWERRTWPVVSVSGTPPPALCRRVHLRTTDCDVWADNAIEALGRATTDW